MKKLETSLKKMIVMTTWSGGVNAHSRSWNHAMQVECWLALIRALKGSVKIISSDSNPSVISNTAYIAKYLVVESAHPGFDFLKQETDIGYNIRIVQYCGGKVEVWGALTRQRWTCRPLSRRLTTSPPATAAVSLIKMSTGLCEISQFHKKCPNFMPPMFKQMHV